MNAMAIGIANILLIGYGTKLASIVRSADAAKIYEGILGNLFSLIVCIPKRRDPPT